MSMTSGKAFAGAFTCAFACATGLRFGTAGVGATLEAGGVTVAVLGTGPDIAYPARHQTLLRRGRAVVPVAFLPGALAVFLAPGLMLLPVKSSFGSGEFAGMSRFK